MFIVSEFVVLYKVLNKTNKKKNKQKKTKNKQTNLRPVVLLIIRIPIEKMWQMVSNKAVY